METPGKKIEDLEYEELPAENHSAQPTLNAMTSILENVTTIRAARSIYKGLEKEFTGSEKKSTEKAIEVLKTVLKKLEELEQKLNTSNIQGKQNLLDKINMLRGLTRGRIKELEQAQNAETPEANNNQPPPVPATTPPPSPDTTLPPSGTVTGPRSAPDQQETRAEREWNYNLLPRFEAIGNMRERYADARTVLSNVTDQYTPYGSTLSKYLTNYMQKLEADLNTQVQAEINKRESVQLAKGGKPLTNYEKWKIALEILPQKEKVEIEGGENPGRLQKIMNGLKKGEDWFLGKNKDTKSKVSLALAKSLMVTAGALVTGDGVRLWRGAWRAAQAVGVSYLSDTKPVKDLVPAMVQLVEKFEKLNKWQKGAAVLAGGVGLVGIAQIGAVSASSIAIGAVGAGVRLGINKLAKLLGRMKMERVGANFDIDTLMQNYAKVEAEFEKTERMVKYAQTLLGVSLSVGIADVSAHSATTKPEITPVTGTNNPQVQQTAPLARPGLWINERIWGGHPEEEIRQGGTLPEVTVTSTNPDTAVNPDTMLAHSLQDNKMQVDNLSQTSPFTGNEVNTTAQPVVTHPDSTSHNTAPVPAPKTTPIETLTDKKVEPTKPAASETGVSKPSTTPALEKIAGMDAKYVVDKGLGVTHAMREQVAANQNLGKELADQIGYTGKVGTPAFYKALGQHFGYIDEHGREVRVKWGGEHGMAAYKFEKLGDEWIVKEYHLKDGTWSEIETHDPGAGDSTFEGDTKDNIENPRYNPVETHDYEYLHERKLGKVSLDESEHAGEDISEQPTIQHTGPVETPVQHGPVEAVTTTQPAAQPKPAEEFSRPPQASQAPAQPAPTPAHQGGVGYMTSGSYTAGASYGPGATYGPESRAYGFRVLAQGDIVNQMAYMGKERRGVFMSIVHALEREAGVGKPIEYYETIALRGEKVMNADLNAVIQVKGSYLNSDFWYDYKGVNARDFISGNAGKGSGNLRQLAEYMKTLEHAQSKEFLPRKHETVEHFIERAHAHLALEESQGRFDYRNLAPVPHEVPKEARTPTEGGTKSNHAPDENEDQTHTEPTSELATADIAKLKVSDFLAQTKEGKFQNNTAATDLYNDYMKAVNNNEIKPSEVKNLTTAELRQKIEKIKHFKKNTDDKSYLPPEDDPSLIQGKVNTKVSYKKDEMKDYINKANQKPSEYE